MIKEESRSGDATAFGRSTKEAGNLEGRSISLLHLPPYVRPSFLPSFLPYFLVSADERKSFRATASAAEEPVPRRESPLIFGVAAFFPQRRERRWYVGCARKGGMGSWDAWHFCALLETESLMLRLV